MYQVPRKERVEMSLPKKESTITQRLLARITFLERPTITLRAPSHRSVALTERDSISSSTTL